MNLGRSLRRVLELPPKVTAQLAWSMLSESVSRCIHQWRDATWSTRLPLPTATAVRSLPRWFEFDPASWPLDTTGETTALATAAEDILQHRFNLLGAGPVEAKYGTTCPGIDGIRFEPASPVATDRTGAWLAKLVSGPNLAAAQRAWRLTSPNYEPIDWQLDLRSGFRWNSQVASKSIDTFAQPRGADVKLPWELGRLQHLLTLAWSYGFAARPIPGFREPETYRVEFQNEVLDFLAANPPRFGVQWLCTMDVALRAMNLVIAFEVFRACGASFSDAFLSEFYGGLHDHARHITTHLEWNLILRGNHYLADVVGLLYVAAAIPACAWSRSWLQWAAREFAAELRMQFHAAGSNFEGSVPYHLLSSEIALYGTALLLRLEASGLIQLPSGTDSHLEEAHWQRLRGIVTFAQAATIAPRRVAQFGDNDSGRCVRAQTFQDSSLASLDPQPLLDGFAALSEYGPARDNASTLAGMLVGAVRGRPSVATRPDNRHTPATPADDTPRAPATWDSSRSDFAEFGLFRLAAQPWLVIVRAGPVGQLGNGGHAHNDQLSFELACDGQVVVADPGTFVYTPLPDERNAFRSTKCHATLSLAETEQNIWPDGKHGLFTMPERSHGRCVSHSATAFIGEHAGFGSVHRRELSLSPAGLTGIDFCEAHGPVTICFPLDPAVWVIVCDSAGVVLELANQRRLRLLGEGVWHVEKAWYSPGYGVKVPTHHLIFTGTGPKFTWRIVFDEDAP